MQGYFITHKIADKLGLLQNPIVASSMQKTVIVITEEDVKDERPDIELTPEELALFGKWFYENYYQGLMESFVSENA